jgi:tRNA(Ile)-lysidine synthase
LRGILLIRDDGIIRPLLRIRRAQLREWMADRRIGFNHDSSNDLLSHRRNWVRHYALPRLIELEPSAFEALITCAQRANETWDVVNRVVNKWKETYIIDRGSRGFSVARAALSNAAVSGEGIAALLTSHHIAFSQRHIEALRRCKYGGVVVLRNGWRCRSRREELVFCHDSKPKPVAIPFRCPLNLPGEVVKENFRLWARFVMPQEMPAVFPADNLTAYIDLHGSRSNMVYRSFDKNDCFVPYGMDHLVNVREFLKKQRLDAITRQSCGVVALESGEIVWIPTVRVDARFAADSGSNFIVMLCYQEGLNI